jgi:hypothetical protein
MVKNAVSVGVLLCFIGIGIVFAQASENYNLSWHVIGGGGNPMSSNSYRMAGTVGQIIGVSESTNYRIEAGYWNGISALPGPVPGWFDTGPGGYPSIAGTHNGTITPNQTMLVNKLYTYPCPGTGGHTEYVKIWNSTTGGNVTATWNGYTGDWHNITFNNSFTLYANETYNYTIRTGSYPQIIHEPSWNATGGEITCTEFVDVNGKRHEGWIPAMRLS